MAQQRIYLDLLRRYYGYLLLFSGLSPENNKKVTLCELCGEMPNRTDQKILTKIRKERKVFSSLKKWAGLNGRPGLAVL